MFSLNHEMSECLLLFGLIDRSVCQIWIIVLLYSFQFCMGYGWRESVHKAHCATRIWERKPKCHNVLGLLDTAIHGYIDMQHPKVEGNRKKRHFGHSYQLFI